MFYVIYVVFLTPDFNISALGANVASLVHSRPIKRVDVGGAAWNETKRSRSAGLGHVQRVQSQYLQQA